MTMYERIKMLREEKGWSQDELAEKVGYQGRSTVSKIERGERDITGDAIVKFANAFGVTPSFLISGYNEAVEDEKNLVIRANDEKEYRLLKTVQSLSNEQKQMLTAQMEVLLSKLK